MSPSASPPRRPPAVDPSNTVLHVASEASPWAGTGGLGEVIGSLPQRLRRAGVDARVVLPCYRGVEESGLRSGRRHALDLDLAGRRYAVEILEATDGAGTPYLLVRRDDLFDRAGVYGEQGRDYPDNAWRFGVLSRAAVEIVAAGIAPGGVLHLHDWPAALAAVFLAARRQDDPALARVRAVLTIHNIAHQGIFEAGALADLGLPAALADERWLGHAGAVSFLKGGLRFADRLTTVSPRHAREIVTPELGFGLDAALAGRRREITGILNGIDVDRWDPATDPHLVQSYGPGHLAGKAACKAALQAELGLEPAPRAPLVGFVGRLVPQKGVDLLLEALPALLRQGGQLAILGRGQPEIEDAVVAAARSAPGKVAGVIDYNRELTSRVLAGSDLLVMPSRFEPCGLGQMQAMRYGTAPVVHAVGGLRDTVRPPTRGGEGTGFVFRTGTARALARALAAAVKAYRNGAAWRRLVERLLRQDWSWEAAAPRYVALYDRTLREAPRRPPWPAWQPPPVPAPPRETPAGPYLDWGPDLPPRHGENAIRLMVQAPDRIYVYWEVRPPGGATGAARHGLRLELIDHGGERPAAARRVLATDRSDAGEWWIHAEPDHAYSVELGDRDGRVLLASNVVRTPRSGPSPRVDPRAAPRGEALDRRHAASRWRMPPRVEVPADAWRPADAGGHGDGGDRLASGAGVRRDRRVGESGSGSGRGRS